MPIIPRLSKSTNVSELGHLLSQMVDRAIADPKNVRLPEVTLRKRAQMGSFTISAADEQQRLGMVNDIVDLLCHYIGNSMSPHFF